MEQQPKRILLVDDDRFMLKVVAKMLSNDNFICSKAHSVDEAFKLLEREAPDIILSDYQMPGMNGFEFREKVMEDNRWKNIPFVFLTSNTDEDIMLQGLGLQVGDYLLKETPMPVIVSKLNNILYSVREQHQKSIQELRTAAEALNLLSVPKQTPQITGFDIQFWHQSFQNYPGGDFIDFIPVDEDYTFIILGDVMGKKWGAWFFSFNFLSYIRSAVRLCVYDKNLSTASILQKINNVIYLDPVLSDVLSTLSMLLIEHKTGKVVYSGAGDLPLVYYNAAQNSFENVISSGLLLGVLSDGMYDERVLTLNQGDKVLLVSDGMIDFEDETGKKSDFKLFFESLKSILPDEDAFEILKNVTFSKENSKVQVDDCSLIYIHKK
jgi:phosphoserine phosphatase RsbU/P